MEDMEEDTGVSLNLIVVFIITRADGHEFLDGNFVDELVIMFEFFYFSYHMTCIFLSC